MAIYLTADPHFDHEMVMSACGRPWATVTEMNTGLINNINSVVTKKDTLYILGDLSMSRHPPDISRYISRLNGRLILILGNHDCLTPDAYIEMGFKSVHTSLAIDLHGMCTAVLHHDPAAHCVVRPRPLLCGHVHTLFKTIGNTVNVGLDVWGYRPVALTAIIGLLQLSGPQI